MGEPARPDRSFRGLLLHVGPAALYVALVFWGGSLATGELPRIAYSDKVLHLIGFAVMQPLMFRALRYLRPGSGLGTQIWVGALLASGVGAALEVYQMALVYRSAELLDWVADTVGAALAAVIMSMVMRGQRRDSASPAG